MLTKNTFHWILIPDEDKDDNIPTEEHMYFNDDGAQSKYFGILASVFHSQLPSRYYHLSSK